MKILRKHTLFILACLLQFGVSAQNETIHSQSIDDSQFLSEIAKNDSVFWSKALKSSLSEVGTSGIYVQVIEQGSGGKPNSESDVEVHYILTNNLGDTLESTFHSKNTLKINLAHVIKGWKEGFPALNKGGKYRLFVPYEKAYKNGPKEAPHGALCFYIEFIDFGPRGTIAPPPRTNKRIKR